MSSGFSSNLTILYFIPDTSYNFFSGQEINMELGVGTAKSFIRLGNPVFCGKGSPEV